MAQALHRFELGGRRFAIDPDTCFCFECDEICWDVLAHYPTHGLNRITALLREQHDPGVVKEVIGELEWLRATQSILKREKPEDMQKAYTVETGLNRMSVVLGDERTESAPSERAGRRWFGRGEPAPVLSNESRRIAADAVHLLLSRSGEQTDLRIEFVSRGPLTRPDIVVDLCRDALRLARLAGKNLTAAVRIEGVAPPRGTAALEGHALAVSLEISDPDATAEPVRALAKAGTDNLARLVKVVQPGTPGVTGRVIVTPAHPAFGQAAAALHDAGFKTIELDMDGAYAVNPSLEPAAMLSGLQEMAVYYANMLLKRKYFRLDPIAALFWRIYDGSPSRRADPAGTNEFAVDADGAIYPSRLLLGYADHCLGHVGDGTLDEDRRRRFDDVGTNTTGACRRCWARHLCGGGNTAVHQALSGDFRQPHEGWCEAQRAWMTQAVSAFNILSAEQVNFTRVYQSLDASAKPSLFSMVRMAMQATIAIRPLEEADAEMLMRWENWREAAYFLHNERGLLLGTKYDREMDSLHPLGLEQELVLTRRDGTPLGLLKVRPTPIPGHAHAWLFMANEADYAAPEVRKGFKLILDQTTNQQGMRSLVVFAAENETGLHAFLEDAGLRLAGIQREALYLHGAYRDIRAYSLTQQPKS